MIFFSLGISIIFEIIFFIIVRGNFVFKYRFVLLIFEKLIRSEIIF